MSQFRPTLLALIIAAGFVGISPVMAPVAFAAEPEPAKTETVRPEVGLPLQAVQPLVDAKKYKEALDKVAEADAVAGKTPFESFMVNRIRLSVAYGAENAEIAASAYEALASSGRFPAAEKLTTIRGIAGVYYRAKEYPKAIEWFSRYLKEGGDDPTVRPLQIQSYYESGDFATAFKEMQNDVLAIEKAGKTPTEDQLKLLLSYSKKLNDKTVLAETFEKLNQYYPKKEYWLDLLNRIQAKPTYAGRLDLDVYRLKYAIGQLSGENDFMNMGTLAIQGNVPSEAKKIVDLGYSTKALGSGADEAKHKRLLELATKEADKEVKTLAQSEAGVKTSKNGTGLFSLGYAYVTIGQYEKGIAMMEQGLARGGLSRPEDAKLHLGVAYYLSDNKSKAVQMFKTVQGVDGTTDLAKLWIAHISKPLN